MKQNIRILLIAVVAAMPAAANAGEAGIAKMSFDGCAPGCPSTPGCTTDGCNTGGYYCDPCGNGAYYSSCNGNHCSKAAKINAWGLNWGDPCGPVGKAARCGVPGAACIRHCCSTKAFPDAGWAPPAHTAVGYTSRGFSAYTGNSGPFAGGAPMVYQPTDTTQLGYSYANVPTWQPDPSRIPPTPHPSMFHNRACPCGGVNGCCLHQPYYAGAACPTCDPGMVMMIPADMPLAVAFPEASVPAAQPATQGSSIRTVSTSKKVSRKAQSASRGTGGADRPKSAPQKKRGWFGLPSLSEIKF